MAITDTFYTIDGIKIWQLGPNETIPPGARIVAPVIGSTQSNIPRPFVPQVTIPSALTFANQATTQQNNQFIQQRLTQGSSQLPNFTSTFDTGSNPFGASSSQTTTTPGQQATRPQGGGFTAVAPTAPGNIPGPTSFIGQIPFFLNAILSTPAGALPKGPLWVVVFDFDSNIKNTIRSVREYEPRMPEPWQIENALETVTTHRFQDEKGCMFAQTLTLPGEALLYTREGIQYNSFIRGGVGVGRQDFDSVRIGFLNTNVSFVDNVIRPWVVMTGHLGMIARPPSQKYRCNMTVYKLGIDQVDRPPFVAQQFNFWEVCPINVSNESLDYSGDGRIPIKEAEFVFQWYTTTSYKNTFTTFNAEEIFAGTGRPEIRRAVPVQ